MRSRPPAGTIVLTVLIIAAACSSELGPAPAPRENGAIVFLAWSFEDESEQLYSINEDGSSLRRLTNDLTLKISVAPSPDGARIAYSALDGPFHPDLRQRYASIYVIGADGSNRRVLCTACTRTGFMVSPEPSDAPQSDLPLGVPDSLSWSPDGTRLVAPGRDGGVQLIDVQSGAARTFETPEPIGAVAWSPAGSLIALSHSWFSTPGNALGDQIPERGTMLAGDPPERPGGIYLLDVGTGRIDDVISTSGLAHLHGWSQDGDLIAFTRTIDDDKYGELAVYSVSENRSWPVVAAERGQATLGAAWSPVDDLITDFTDQYDEESRFAKALVVMSHDGTESLDLPLCAFEGAFDGDDCAAPGIAWSPDGQTIVYQAFIAHTPIISVLVLQDVDGSSTRTLRLPEPTTLETGNETCCLAWLPA